MERLISNFQAAGGDKLRSLISNLHAKFELISKPDADAANTLMFDLNRLQALMNELAPKGRWRPEAITGIFAVKGQSILRAGSHS
ncbi:hypothetical protein [Celeribacter litoreus]|uniref:hypothetical protein n=1 Tax=Celeribacter litoreus TaxID=2876714 RepID=UPI001CCE402E|nr:hypothetical protein [Celeribacter litoreus]